MVIGLFYIYKLFLQEFKHKIFAALLAAFIFTSANLSYYGISTISDIQSMALSMMGFYFFYNWVKFKTNKNLIIAIIAFSLAGLLKASSAMIYSLSLLYLVFWHIESRGSKQKIFTKQNCLRLLLLMFPFIIVIAWYSYVKDYNTKNYNGFFLIGTLPIWELEPQKINDNLRSLIFNLIPQILNPVILFAILIFIITNSFFSIKSFFSNSVILICCVVVFILYILLFFDALNVHDYYLINMTGVLVITIFFIFKIIFNRLKQYNFRITLFILGFMVLFNTYTSSAKTWKKINFNVTTFENSFLFNAEEQNNFFWIYWLDRAMFKPLEDKEFKLEKVGILSTDTIFCIGDQTINRSLYLLNRVGYTSVNSSVSQMPQFVKEHQNIKYIILIDSTLRKTPHLQTIFKNKIYEKESLSIYKVKK